MSAPATHSPPVEAWENNLGLAPDLHRYIFFTMPAEAAEAVRGAEEDIFFLAGHRALQDLRASSSPAKRLTAISEAARPYLRTLVTYWAPGGVEDDGVYTVDHEGKTLTIDLGAGRWHQPSADKSGGGAVSLAATLFNISSIEAGDKISAMLGSPAGPN